VKAISLWQPWASLVALGAKRIETRHWPTNVRGTIAIHAAKKWNRELGGICLEMPFRVALWPIDFEPVEPDALPRGAVVAVADLYTCAPITFAGSGRPGTLDPAAITREERAFGNYEAGRYAWGLRNVRRLAEPIPFRGAQGFFDVPDELMALGLP